MYLLKKPITSSPSIPRRQLNFKGPKTLKNDVSELSGSSPSKDYESVGIAESTGTSDEWTDMEETLIESSTLESSLDQVVIVSSHWGHNFDSDSFESFNHGAPIACSTPKSSFVEDERESSNDYSPVEQVRFADSFNDFEYGEPSAAPTIYSPKALFAEDEEGSSRDYSPVEQARFAGISPEGAKYWNPYERTFERESAKSHRGIQKLPKSSFVEDQRNISHEGEKYWNPFERTFEIESAKSLCGIQKLPKSSFVEDQRNFFGSNFGAPIAAATTCSPNSSSVKDGKEILSEGEEYWNSFVRGLEIESAKRSRATQKKPESSSVKGIRKISPEGAKNLNSFERSFENESAKSSSATQKQPESSSVKGKRKLYSSFEKEPSKSCCATQTDIHPEKIPKRRPKLKKRKLQYSGNLLGDKNPKNSKGASKQISEVESTKKDFFLCEENICPLGRGLVPYRKKSLPPPFFEGDVPIDDIYYLINGSKLKTKKIRTKRSRENKAKEK